MKKKRALVWEGVGEGALCVWTTPEAAGAFRQSHGFNDNTIVRVTLEGIAVHCDNVGTDEVLFNPPSGKF